MIPPKMSTDASMPDGNLVSTEKTVEDVPETENLVTSTSTTAASGKARNLSLFASGHLQMVYTYNTYDFIIIDLLEL